MQDFRAKCKKLGRSGTGSFIKIVQFSKMLAEFFVGILLTILLLKEKKEPQCSAASLQELSL